MKVISIVIGPFDTVSKDFDKYQEHRLCIEFLSSAESLFAGNVENLEEGTRYLRLRNVACYPV